MNKYDFFFVSKTCILDLWKNSEPREISKMACNLSQFVVAVE